MFVTLTVEVASRVHACVPAREILYMKQVLLVFFLVNPFYLHKAVIILKADERDPEHPKGSTPWLSGRSGRGGMHRDVGWRLDPPVGALWIHNVPNLVLLSSAVDFAAMRGQREKKLPLRAGFGARRWWGGVKCGVKTPAWSAAAA